MHARGTCAHCGHMFTLGAHRCVGGTCALRGHTHVGGMHADVNTDPHTHTGGTCSCAALSTVTFYAVVGLKKQINI
jgi:hypothetical protein